MNDKLNLICDDLIKIETGLMYGTIVFSYDKLMCAMKPGHPADILDDILSGIYYDVIAGGTPELDRVKNVLEGLVDFREAFDVKELTPVIKKLRNYVNAQEKQSPDQEAEE